MRSFYFLKRLVLFIWFASLVNVASAQTFYSSNGGNIADNSAVGSAFVMNVSGLDSAILNTHFGLDTVCININHPRIEDLYIWLLSPDGYRVELTAGLNANSSGYVNTCFSTASTISLSQGTAPFSGTYYPKENMGNFNNGRAGNGLWRLYIQDVAAGDSGVVMDWTLRFGYHPGVPGGTGVGPCNGYSPGGCICPDSSGNCLLLPDIFIGSKMLGDTSTAFPYMHEYVGHLDVTNASANVGYGPMEVIGTGLWYCGDTLVNGNVLCPDGTYSKQLVNQRLYVKTNQVYFQYIDTPAGKMSFDSNLGHHHLHVEDWIENTLRIRGPEADPTKWIIIGTGNKVTSCLTDGVQCEAGFKACQYYDSTYLLPNLPNNGLGGYDGCGFATQGISVGWADIYQYTYGGQNINFDTICNGDYYIVAHFDPKHHFVDYNRANDVTAVPVTLKLQRSNCCVTSFEIDTIDLNHNTFQFVDRSRAMPNQWLWNFGNNDTSQRQFPVHHFDSAGNYTITLKTRTAQGCTDSLSYLLHVSNPSSITTLREADYSFTLFPNPTKGVVNLSFNLFQEASIAYEVYNVLGANIISALSQVHKSGACQFTISLPQSGIYLLRYAVNGQVFYRKIIAG